MTKSLAAPGLKFLPGFVPPVYRELRPMEHGLLQEHLFRLSLASQHLRFGYPVSSRAIEQYCRNDGKPMPIICGAFIGGDLRGVVELRFGKGLAPDTAELAISVEDDWQDIGIGTALMALALRCARDYHLGGVEVNFLPHNTPMRRLAQKFGATFSHQTGLTKGYFAPSEPGFAALAGSKRPQ